MSHGTGVPCDMGRGVRAASLARPPATRSVRPEGNSRRVHPLARGPPVLAPTAPAPLCRLTPTSGGGKYGSGRMQNGCTYAHLPTTFCALLDELVPMGCCPVLPRDLFCVVTFDHPGPPSVVWEWWAWLYLVSMDTQRAPLPASAFPEPAQSLSFTTAPDHIHLPHAPPWAQCIASGGGAMC